MSFLPGDNARPNATARKACPEPLFIRVNLAFLLLLYSIQPGRDQDLMAA